VCAGLFGARSLSPSMPDALHVRPAASNDAERVREVYERAIRDADAYLPGADHGDLATPTEAYAGGAFLVGEVDGAVVTVGSVRSVDGEDAVFEMKRVAVLPATRDGATGALSSGRWRPA
jgi:hypothetical protein